MDYGKDDCVYAGIGSGILNFTGLDALVHFGPDGSPKFGIDWGSAGQAVAFKTLEKGIEVAGGPATRGVLLNVGLKLSGKFIAKTAGKANLLVLLAEGGLAAHDAWVHYRDCVDYYSK